MSSLAPWENDLRPLCLVYSAEGSRYIGKITHFSSLDFECLLA